MYDTVKGSDWLGDQDAIVCQRTPMISQISNKPIALHVQRSAACNPRTRGLWNAILANR